MCNSLLKRLIFQMRNQDMSVFVTIFNEFKRLIFFYANKSKVEDSEQELILFFIELLYDIPLEKFSNNEGDSLSRYIAVSIRNKYIAMAKLYNKTESKLERIDSKILFSQDNREDLLLSDALESLSYKQRVVIVYKYIYCYRDVEIAELLGITRQAVNRINLRAIEKLRNYYMGV